MWRNVIIPLIALMFSVAAFGQRQVQVRVEGREQGEALVAAYVHVFTKASKQPVLSVMTDEHGLATVDVNDSTSFIEVTSIGYAPVKVPLNAAVPHIKIKLTKTFSGLDEVVVTGVTAPVKLQNALSPYQIITKAAMQAQGAVTVKDALKNQLNINMGNDAMLGSKTSMQGMKGDKVKILIDGMALNGREMGEIDLGQINLNNVEKIEIVQGPMSVVYGTDALGGVINIITKKNNIPWRIEAGGYYETIGQYNFDVAGSYQFRKRHQFTLGGGRNFFQGWKPLDSLLERAHLWKPKEQYIGNLAYSYTAKSSFRLQFAADFVNEKLSYKDANYKVNSFGATAQDEYFKNTRLMTRLNLSGKIGEGSWQIQNGYNIYHRTRNTYVKDLVTLNQELSEADGVQDTTRFDDFISRGTYSNRLKKLDYTIGYDINLQEGKTGKISGGSGQINDYAAFLTTTYAVLRDRLKFQPAVRYSYNTAYTAPLVPSLNILYSGGEKWQFRFAYSRGFRAPSLKELYLHFYDTQHEVDGNPELKSEKGHHIQLSTSWTAYRKETDFVKLMFTGFHNDVYDQINLFQPDLKKIYATYINVDRMRNVIGTLQADGQWKNLYMQVGYSFLQILDADTAVYSNSQQATATVQYFWKKPGVNISMFYKHFGKQPRLEATIDGGYAYNGAIEPYSFWDASIEKRFWKNRVQLVGGVKNILDVQNPTVTGAQTGGIHSGSTGALTTGRSVFTSLRLTLQ